MPNVISNASTLIHLTAIGRLALLKEFFSKITVPPAVWQEVVIKGSGQTGAAEVETASADSWIEVVPAENVALLSLLRRDLDEGEAEAIALALETAADLILLDESDARQAAEVLGLSKTGVIGLLIRAKLEGKIAKLRPELDRLREEGGFWISDDLYRRALEAVGENP